MLQSNFENNFKMREVVMFSFGFRLALLACAMAFVPLFAKDYSIDKGSKVGFRITKYLIMSVEGVFREFSGHLRLDENGAITALNIQAVSDSVSTGKAKRDKHAKEKLLNAAQHPFIKLSLVSYKLKSPNDKRTGILVAKLTLCGKSKKVRFKSTLDTSQSAPKLSLEGSFNSKDFDIKGSLTSSNTVDLILDTAWGE